MDSKKTRADYPTPDESASAQARRIAELRLLNATIDQANHTYGYRGPDRDERLIECGTRVLLAEAEVEMLSLPRVERLQLEFALEQARQPWPGVAS